MASFITLAAFPNKTLINGQKLTLKINKIKKYENRNRR
jgi:hypothetical protein